MPSINNALLQRCGSVYRIPAGIAGRDDVGEVSARIAGSFIQGAV